MAGRLAAVRREMASRGLEVLAVYGDREHAANLHEGAAFQCISEGAQPFLGQL
jgi:hypothetical protein